MKTKVGEFELSDEKTSLQVERIHHLLKDAYWCTGISKEVITAAINGSLCFGVYTDGKQVGFARVVTDCATFAWLCDVIIDTAYRGKGLAKQLMSFILAHPELQGLRRICLATKDAHKLYEQYGFMVTQTPQNWMEIKDNEIYLRPRSTSPQQLK